MELVDRLHACRQNKYELDKFISDYKPFIATVVQKQVGRFVQYGKDDELSVGLMAFEEAVRAFDNNKGNFLPFAESVIKRRLIDYYRVESRNKNVIPLSSFYNELEDVEVDITEKQSIEKFSIQQESEARKYEIIELQKELGVFGLSFGELVEASPKHEETKKIYSNIIDAIIKNENLVDKIKTKKYYPVAELEILTGIHRKKIERSRRYVIAVIIILTGDYKFVQSFINWRR